MILFTLFLWTRKFLFFNLETDIFIYQFVLIINKQILTCFTFILLLGLDFSRQHTKLKQNMAWALFTYNVIKRCELCILIVTRSLYRSIVHIKNKSKIWIKNRGHSHLTSRKSLFVNVFNQSNSFENPICIETRLKNMLEVTLFYFKYFNAMGTSTSKFAIKSTWFSAKTKQFDFIFSKKKN